MKECEYILPLPFGAIFKPPLRDCGGVAQWQRTWNGLTRHYCEKHRQMIAHVTPDATWAALPSRFDEMRRSLDGVL